MKKRPKTGRTKVESGDRLSEVLFYIVVSLLVLIPLAFSASIYTKYSLPKFVVLLIGSSLLVLLLALMKARAATGASMSRHLVRSRLVRVVCIYFILVAFSSLFGVAPVVSLFGTHFNYMGLITRLCFFLFFIALIFAVGASEDRFQKALWAIACTGMLVALYAVAQAFDIDPFVSQGIYTFTTPDGPVVRVCATLGHSDYLGNFLLYTTPLGAGLALASRGWSRIILTISTLLSLAAIALSGTRGAWAGIIVGAGVFAFLEFKSGAAGLIPGGRRLTKLAAFAFSIIILVSIIVLSPAARSMSNRAKALMTEGVSSSGRMILWRDSLKLVPQFSLIGSGSEGLRKALLEFKSRELARLSPTANNESSHNSYLDTAILFGLPGLIAYIFIIVLTMSIFLRVRKASRSQSRRIILTGLAGSFAGVLAHNIFIFDQITTGLYFFAFIALAQTASNIWLSPEINSRDAQTEHPHASKKNPAARKKNSLAPRRSGGWAGPVVAFGLCLAAIWYSAGLLKSDMAYKEMFNPASPLDYDRLTSLGERVTSSPLPTGAYDYLFARVVQLFVNQLPAASKALDKSEASAIDVSAIRAGALRMGIEHAEKSLAHTVTPELNYSLLGALALAAGDAEKLRFASEEALRADPNNYYTRWLMAEAYLARGEKEQAAREAETALELSPSSREAASALARARGKDPNDDLVIAEILAEARSRTGGTADAATLIRHARRLSRMGNYQGAQIRLLTAISRSNDSCPACHQELALIYEKMNRYGDAIAEWEIFINQAPESDGVEQIKVRLEALKMNNTRPQ